MDHSRPSPATRRLITWILLGVLIALGGWQVSQLTLDRALWPPDDFVEYWAAGRLNFQGQNPYDPELLLPLEVEAGRDTDVAIMMWNPPWTLSLAMPIGALSAHTAQLLWLVLNLAIIVFCADRCWHIYGGSADRRMLAWIIAFTFLPTLFALKTGQITPILLLGCVGFLWGIRADRPMLAGASTVLMAIKPHLFVLFWPAVVVWALVGRRWRFLAGAVGTAIITSAIPMIFNPQVFADYWQALTHRTPDYWLAPTLSTILRFQLGWDRFWLQFVPILPGLVWLAWYGYRHRHDWDWLTALPYLVLVSFTLSPYGAWPFDMVLFLLPWIHLFVSTTHEHNPARTRFIVAGYVVIVAGAVLLNILQTTSFWFFWLPPAVLLVYTLACWPRREINNEC